MNIYKNLPGKEVSCGDLVKVKDVNKISGDPDFNKHFMDREFIAVGIVKKSDYDEPEEMPAGFDEDIVVCVLSNLSGDQGISKESRDTFLWEESELNVKSNCGQYINEKALSVVTKGFLNEKQFVVTKKTDKNMVSSLRSSW